MPISLCHRSGVVVFTIISISALMVTMMKRALDIHAQLNSPADTQELRKLASRSQLDRKVSVADGTLVF